MSPSCEAIRNALASATEPWARGTISMERTVIQAAPIRVRPGPQRRSRGCASRAPEQAADTAHRDDDAQQYGGQVEFAREQEI